MGLVTGHSSPHPSEEAALSGPHPHRQGSSPYQAPSPGTPPHPIPACGSLPPCRLLTRHLAVPLHAGRPARAALPKQPQSDPLQLC